jgi:hypothetical protein
MHCANCKTMNDPNEGFCRRCGRQLIFMPMPLLSQSTPIKRKKSYTRHILIGSLLLLGLAWLAMSMISAGSMRGKEPSVPVSRLTPTPTPALSDDQRLARAKALLLQGFDQTQYKTAIDDLKAIPALAKEYREAQSLLKKFSRLLASEKPAASKTPTQR